MNGVAANHAYGAICDKWQCFGADATLGEPTSSEGNTAGLTGRKTSFQNGTIYWSGPTGAHEVQGLILEEYVTSGEDDGPCGLPVSDEEAEGIWGCRISYFSKGYIDWCYPESIGVPHCSGGKATSGDTGQPACQGD